MEKKCVKHLYLACVFSLGFLLLLFLNIEPVFAKADLTVTLTSDTFMLDMVPGALSSSSQTLTVSTNNPTGYYVMLETTGQTTNLVNQSNNNFVIPTFTLPSGSTSLPANSTGYGYGYSIDGGANYLPAPGVSGNGDKIFNVNTPGTNSHQLTFGAKVSYDSPSGIYVNTFKLEVVANISNCEAGYICYYGNGDDETGEMDPQAASSNTDVTLIASNFSRPGYGFAGWNTAQDGSGTNYGPNQTINSGDLSATGLKLYARWIASAGNLQGWKGCANMSTGSITALTDTRDGNTYAIVKHADGNCWMMENLRLDLSDPNVEISDINTNNPTHDFANAANNHPASSDSFCETNSGACVNRINFNTNNINRNLTASYDANNSTSSWYSYGVYYNWYTATAGNGTYNFSTEGSFTDGDICPAGWRLPTGYGDNGDLAKLDKALGGNGKNQTSGSTGIAASVRWRVYPLNHIYSGEQRGNTGYNRNVSSGYTTSSVVSSERSVNLWLRPTAVNLNSNTNPKSRGQTIRCVIKNEYSAVGNIHYDSNGGTGTMADQTNVDLVTSTAASNTFTKENSEFVSWNTRADGTGVTVVEGGLVATAASSMGITDGDTLTLYAIWRSTYRIVYNGNNADAGSMSDIIHGDIENGKSIILIPSNYSRTGYGFAGWSMDASAATKLANHESVKIYGPNETVSIDNSVLANADNDNLITLYAVWLPASQSYTMQTFGSNECSALSNGDILALTDNRDNNVYAVAKLGDNHCWMVENLRLMPSTTTFSNANTNNPTSSFISSASSSSSSNSLCGSNSTSCVDKVAYNSNNIDRGLIASYNGSGSTSYWYSYGILYNWYTASAGNGTFSMSSGSVSGDICPSGWRLPTGGNGGEFATLNTAINSGVLNKDLNLRKFPNNLIYSGDYNQNASGGRGTYGRYWSATASNANNAFRLGFTSGEVTPVKGYNKWDAFAVRCIVKP